MGDFISTIMLLLLALCAGVFVALPLLAVANRAPAIHDHPAAYDWRTAEQRRADERAALEAEYSHAGHWTVVNGRTCYVVPQTDPFTGDGEEVGDYDSWQYWLGDYHSDKQFTIAGVIGDSGSVVRRSLFGWGSYL